MIWCVFDRDANSDEDLQNAELMAKRFGYEIAYSNPAFEVGYLYHFIDQRGDLKNYNAVERLLAVQEHIPGYDKTVDYYDLLFPNQGDALMRAKRRVEELEQEGLKLIRRGGNPYTTVYRLVACLKERSTK